MIFYVLLWLHLFISGFFFPNNWKRPEYEFIYIYSIFTVYYITTLFMSKYIFFRCFWIHIYIYIYLLAKEFSWHCNTRSFYCFRIKILLSHMYVYHCIELQTDTHSTHWQIIRWCSEHLTTFYERYQAISKAPISTRTITF